MAIFVPGSRRGEFLKIVSSDKEFGAKSGIMCSSGPSGEFLVDMITSYQLLVYIYPLMTCRTKNYYKRSTMAWVTASWLRVTQPVVFNRFGWSELFITYYKWHILLIRAHSRNWELDPYTDMDYYEICWVSSDLVNPLGSTPQRYSGGIPPFRH